MLKEKTAEIFEALNTHNSGIITNLSRVTKYRTLQFFIISYIIL